MLLAELTAGSRQDAERRAELVPADELERLASQRSPALDALSFLAPAAHIKVIAEVKRASPSRGDMAEIADPALLARTYEQSGASAISVLTEERRFKGSLADLESVRANVSIPVLRKEFVSIPYQVFEARAAGADMVLLIVAALEPKVLSHLYSLINDLGMTALVEAHSLSEVEQALNLEAPIIGVNARDLNTFDLDRNLFGRLTQNIPSDVIKVAESAVRTVSDVRHYRDAGADVVLVGEALVTNDAQTMLESFVEVA